MSTHLTLLITVLQCGPVCFNHVCAADLRGFGESERPKDVAGYELSNLVKDLEGDLLLESWQVPLCQKPCEPFRKGPLHAAGVLDALGIHAAHVIGHDWGAILVGSSLDEP